MSKRFLYSIFGFIILSAIINVLFLGILLPITPFITLLLGVILVVVYVKKSNNKLVIYISWISLSLYAILIFMLYVFPDKIDEVSTYYGYRAMFSFVIIFYVVTMFGIVILQYIKHAFSQGDRVSIKLPEDK